MAGEVSVKFEPSRVAKTLAEWLADPGLRSGSVLYRPGYTPVFVVFFDYPAERFRLLQVGSWFWETLEPVPSGGETYFCTGSAKISLTIPTP